jgi:hypothetical protein
MANKMTDQYVANNTLYASGQARGRLRCRRTARYKY